MLVACGSASDSNEKSSHSEQDMAVEENMSGEPANLGTEMSEGDTEQQDTDLQEADNKIGKENASGIEQKIIYTANLQVEVKEYQEAYNAIESQVEKLKGYIVDSMMYEEEESKSKHGHITARVPQDSFQEFIQLVEDGSSKVLESSTSGQDVTEEYVDLKSRLKSKEVVEKRLLTFMEDAEKTEDLLNISNELADIQEQIEAITGQMKYLENKSDLATVTISMEEKNVSISGTGRDDLNTWEQTKQQFMKSINFLITSLSSLFIFLAGNLPVFLIIGVLILIGYLVFRRNRKHKRNAE